MQPKPLINILMHFRQSVIGICAYIREMFLRIKIRDRDQDALRFLWREGDPSRPVDVYIMESMIFGSRSSPCSSQYVKNVNAAKYKDIYARAYRSIVEYHYIDDSFTSAEEAIATCRRVVEIHRDAGFELRGFSSNSKAVLSELAEHDVDVDVDLCHLDSKVLGLYWNREDDIWRFKLDKPRIAKYRE